MEEKAINGVRWTILTYAVSKVITFCATVVLARLLVPADFGVVMLAFVAINVVGLFGDLGLGATLVVRHDLDERDMGTVLTMLLASGAVLALLLVVVSPLLASAFDEPRLRGVLVALSPMTIVGSFNWFYQWYLQRELEFRTRFFGFVAQTTAYSSVAIGSAVLGAGVWSIVAGHLAGQTSMAFLYLVLGGAIRPRFNRALAWDLLRTSKGFMLQTAALLLQGEADYVAVGITRGPQDLGLYSMAFRLGELQYLAIADPVARVTFPGFARMRARGEDVHRQYLGVLRLVALAAFPVGALLSAAAGPFTRLVYGSKWVGMITALSVLAVWGTAKCIQFTIQWFLNSIGGQHEAGVISLVFLAPQVPLLFWAADAFGIAAVGGVLLGAVLVSLPFYMAAVKRRLDVSIAAHLSALWPVTGAAIAAWAATRATVSIAPTEELLALVVPVAVGGAVFLAVVSILAPGILPTAIRQARRAALGGDTPAVVPDVEEAEAVATAWAPVDVEQP